MSLRVAIDFGTSSTCVAVSVNGREPQVVVVDGQPLLSSAVYAGNDGRLFVGQEADRQAALDPSRYEPHPKRRVDEAELLLGDTVVPVGAVFRAVLSRAVAEARRIGGGAIIDQLVLTHPADWGGFRTQVLRKAAAGLAARVVTVPEPVAAAVFHAAGYPAAGPGDRPLAVLDLGGGTVDVSVVVRRGRGYQVLATKGDPGFGGADIDQLLMEHLGSLVSATDPDAWRALVEGRELPDRRRRRVLRQDVRGAKETLSRHPYTDVPLPPPFPDAHLTRADLERLIEQPIGRAVDLTVATIREAGLVPAQLTGIFLVGGSSRIPLVASMVADRTGVVPVTLDQPETVVARGALRAVSAEPEQTGVLGTRRHPELTVPDPSVLSAEPTLPVVRRPPLTPPRPPVQSGPSGPQRLPGPPVTQVVPPKPRSRAPLWIGAAVLVAVAAVLVAVLVPFGKEEPSARVIAQYEYQFALPTGWTQTGGNPTLLRTEIKPAGGESGDDLVLVEEKRLAFDSDADRARAVDKLRSDFDNHRDQFSDFEDKASFAGRDVVRYRQDLPEKEVAVDWYVIFIRNTQVSIGCQYSASGRDQVRQACDEVVRSMTVTG